MIRLLYALSVAALISGTAWAATGVQSERQHANAGVGIVLLAALQR